MMKIFRVGSKCQQTLCGCSSYDNLPIDEHSGMLPPLHKDCDCVIITEKDSKDDNKFITNDYNRICKLFDKIHIEYETGVLEKKIMVSLISGETKS